MISGLGVEHPCIMASEFEQSGPDVACGAVPPLITAEMEAAEWQRL